MTRNSSTAAKSSLAFVSSEPLVPILGSVQRVVVHPTVLLSMLDHHVRRSDGSDAAPVTAEEGAPTAFVQGPQHRVLGALLGTRSEDGSQVEITSCFPVPHGETEDQVALDMLYQTEMRGLFRRLSKEPLIGWYATGAPLQASHTALIHEYYLKETQPFPAIYLNVDARLEGSQLPVRAFISANIAASGDENAEAELLMIPVACHVSYGESEKIALAALGTFNQENVPLTSDVLSIQQSLKQVLLQLRKVMEYVELTLKQGDFSSPKNIQVGQLLWQWVHKLPTNVTESGIAAQDLQNVIQLAQLTRTQLDLTEKLQQIQFHQQQQHQQQQQQQQSNA